MSKNIQQRKQWFQGKIRKLIYVTGAFSLIVTAVMTLNIIRIYTNRTGAGSTLSNVVSSEYKNDYYTIGNNPTKISETYFKELNKAIEDNDKEAIASSVVKCFVSEYYTWTNKDGTYDIGGMQYMYAARLKDFEKYTREEVYTDMDLYLSQYGRENLMQVKEVNVSSVTKTDNFAVLDSEGNEVRFEAYEVKASWSFESDTKMDLSSAIREQTFTLINNDGRMEIAAMA